MLRIGGGGSSGGGRYRNVAAFSLRGCYLEKAINAYRQQFYRNRPNISAVTYFTRHDKTLEENDTIAIFCIYI